MTVARASVPLSLPHSGIPIGATATIPYTVHAYNCAYPGEVEVPLDPYYADPNVTETIVLGNPVCVEGVVVEEIEIQRDDEGRAIGLVKRSYPAP